MGSSIGHHQQSLVLTHSAGPPLFIIVNSFLLAVYANKDLPKSLPQQKLHSTI